MNGIKRRVVEALKLKYSLTLILTFVLYFFVAESLLSTTPIVVQEQATPLLFATEINSPLKSSLIHSLDTAKERITVLIYNLCDRQILAALSRAALRGVTVTVVADPYASNDIQKGVGPNVQVYLRKPNGLMHLKIFAIDSHIIWLGSANMSTASLETHGNLCTAFSSKALAEYLEDYTRHLIATEPFAKPHCIIETGEQNLTLFLHPHHGKESLPYLIERIHAATNKIFVAMYTFTNMDLVDALIEAKQRGVDVRVVFDKDSAKNTSKVAFAHLAKANIPIGTRTTPGLLHHKFAIIDSSLEMGSCNWTKAGFFSNCDCILWLEPMTPSQAEWMSNLWQKIASTSTLPLYTYGCKN